MFIFDDKPLSFIHIPKNAGTTLIDAVAKRGHHSNKDIKDKYPIKRGSAHHNKFSYFEKEGMTKGRKHFTIVRNPWSRALSLFLYTLKHTADTIVDMPTQARVHANLCLQGFKGCWMPGGFFDRDHVKSAKHSLRQWNSSDTQLSWIKDERGRIACKWFRMESDLEEVEKICQCSMKSKNERTATNHGHYSLYYDDELRDRIGDVFKEDIETFGYEFELAKV